MPTDAENAAIARTAICGADTGYPSTFHDNLVDVCGQLQARLGEVGRPVPAPDGGGAAGPYWTVEKPSDDVAQQCACRFPVFGGYYTVAELIAYAGTLAAALEAAGPPPPIPLGPPTGLTGTPGPAAGTVILDWDDTPDADSYVVYRDDAVVAEPTGSSHVDAPAPGTYSYTVAAVNEAGKGAGSSPVQVVLDVPPTDPAPPDGTTTDGVFISATELAALPASGDAWLAVLARADNLSGDPANVSVRGNHNIDVLANALIGARLDDPTRKEWVRDQLVAITQAARDNNDVLATLRQLQTYVIAADVVRLAGLDPDFDAQFRIWLDTERHHDYAGGGGGGSVISTHDRKPNNFGTHAGASRVAAAIYLGDSVDLDAAANVWKGWASGDPALIPDGYRWTGTTWQADPDRPAGINAAGATRDGNRLDGVIPEDQERCGEYGWPPCATNYIHGAADGMLAAFHMLSRRGYDAWGWGERAALRQYEWKYEVGQPPYVEYDEFRWQIPLVNHAYDTSFDGADPAATGKNFAFAAWLFG